MDAAAAVAVLIWQYPAIPIFAAVTYALGVLLAYLLAEYGP